MSLITLKTEFNEDLLACRACLTYKRKLYSIHQEEILKAYKNLTGAEVSPYDTLPQYVCNYCTILLLKYNTFRDNCLKAVNYLEEARIRNKHITLDLLNNYQPQTQYKRSEMKLINITQDHLTEASSNNLKINDNDVSDNSIDFNHQPDTIYLSPNPENNLQIYTDTVKIKKETDIPFKNTEKPAKNVKNKQKAPTVTKKNDSVKKKGKYFETNENMKDFEKLYNVEIAVLTREQQINDVLERKLSLNYLHSPYKCELCYKGYMGADILEKHVISQHDSSRGGISCEICKFRYKDRRALNQHLKSHRLKFTCKQCSYVSRTTFNAKGHFKMHSGHIHRCRHCGKSYEKLSSHLSHLRIHHPSEFVWCDLCGEAFIGTFGLNAHKKRAHRLLSLPVACASCDMRFIDNTALQRHSTHTSCSGHTCVHCGEMFEQRLDLRDHLLDNHRSCKVFSCEKCNKTFTRESLYSAHYRRIHVETEDKALRKKERPWICEVCGKTLPNKCMLLYHQRNHTGERPYECTICPKRFTMKKLLQSHQRVHTSERPYMCKLCPKTFKGLSALRTHEHIHSGLTKMTSKRQ